MNKWVNSEGYTDITACKAICNFTKTKKKRRYSGSQLGELRSFKRTSEALGFMIRK